MVLIYSVEQLHLTLTSWAIFPQLVTLLLCLSVVHSPSVLKVSQKPLLLLPTTHPCLDDVYAVGETPFLPNTPALNITANPPAFPLDHTSLQTKPRAHQVHQSNRERYPRLTPGRGNAVSKAHEENVTIFSSFKKKKSKAKHQHICNQTTFCNLPPRFCTANKRLNKQTLSNVSGLPDAKKAFSQ